jgi:calcineurin-like phosphoesterase family protein
MEYFVTSNLQLGRPYAIKNYDRPFDTLKDMQNGLIDNWNSVVGNNDIVYHLGNFAWDPKVAQESLKQLNGHIKLLPAEHDQPIIDLKLKKVLPDHVEIINRILPLGHLGVCLSYWPMMEWPGSGAGYYSLIGYPVAKYKTDLEKKIINVCPDFWAMKPLSITQTKELFQDLAS